MKVQTSAVLAACAIGAAAPAAADAAITTKDATQGATAAQLAQALAGGGVAISDAKLTGAPAGAGTFTGGAPLGIDAGVVLSSGKVADVAGPNDDDGFGTSLGTPGDADLDQLVSGETQDASVLEFDVVSSRASLSFRYAFGSEEYTEWVNSDYNDAFAFYVGGQNCATVPMIEVGKAPVSVNTVNPFVNADLYRDNENAALDTQLDGLTKVLTCSATVTPGVKTHVKLVIADRGDGALDSAVALQAGSLVAGTPTSLAAKPALLSLNPLGLALFEPSATLKKAGAPFAGKTVAFSVKGKSICSAVTNAQGVAKCSGLAKLLDLTLNGGYDARYAGDAEVLPSSAKGALIK